MKRKYVMKSAEWVAQMEAQAARIAELDAFYTDAAMQITAARERADGMRAKITSAFKVLDELGDEKTWEWAMNEMSEHVNERFNAALALFRECMAKEAE